MLEALRLWPTTPMVLRQSTSETRWEHGSMPADTGVLIHAPFFHRDDTRLEHADRFTPELWMDGQTAGRDWPLIPFSDGPVMCPGRHLVLMLSSAMLAALLGGGTPAPAPTQVLDPARLPGTLDNFALRFSFAQ
jgi:cytochrome P450